MDSLLYLPRPGQGKCPHDVDFRVVKIKGLNGLNKHERVRLLCNDQIITLLVARLRENKVNQVAKSIFCGMLSTTHHTIVVEF